LAALRSSVVKSPNLQNLLFSNFRQNHKSINAIHFTLFNSFNSHFPSVLSSFISHSFMPIPFRSFPRSVPLQRLLLLCLNAFSPFGPRTRDWVSAPVQAAPDSPARALLKLPDSGGKF
jgi:hypothetical protein